MKLNLKTLLTAVAVSGMVVSTALPSVAFAQLRPPRGGGGGGGHGGGPGGGGGGGFPSPRPPRPEPGPRPEPRPQPPRPQPGPRPEPRPQPGPRPEPRPQPPRPQPGPRPEPRPQPGPRPEPRPQPGPRPEPRPQPGPRPEPRPQPGPRPEPRPQPGPRPEPRPQPGPRPEPRPQPPRPQPGPRPEPRPQPPRPPRPGPQPGRPVPGHPRPPGPIRPGQPDYRPRRDRNEGRGADQRAIQRRNRIERQREQVRDWRGGQHRSDWERWQNIRGSDRNDWRSRRAWRPRPDLRWVTNHDYWGDRYDAWENTYWYPPVYVYVPIDWVVPMPNYPARPAPGSYPDWSTTWTYQDVQNVALNLEGVARDIYDQMDAVIDTNPNREYANRLMNVLADLIDASENYTDAVMDGTDWVDSLDQLFYLEAEVKLARTTLDGYSKEYLVRDEETAMNQYVQQLLWTYKANYIATDIYY